MATKADFTEDEWSSMRKGVTGAGMLVSVGDADFTDSFGESSALAKYVGAQRQANQSELVRELCDIHGTGFGMTTSQKEVEAETLEALRSAVATLTQKAPDDVGAYRELVVGAASAVAEAKGGGVSEAESAAIAQIWEALGPA